jgi:hypothetical protein
LRIKLVCLLAFLIVHDSSWSGAQEEGSEAARLEVSVKLVGRAYTPELEALLEEWFSAQGQSVELGRQSSVSLEHLLEVSDEDEVRAWLVLPEKARARVYFADAGSSRFFVRNVTLESGLDELGREKLAQIVVASVQAFSERRVQDTPLDSLKEALAEAPSPAAQPAPERSPTLSAPEGAKTRPTERSTSPPVADEAKALSWALAASYVGVYRGPERWSHGPSLSLEGWFVSHDFALGLLGGGRYELPHTVATTHLDLRLQTSQLRLGLFVGLANQERPTWVVGAGGGSDWFAYRPSRGSTDVTLREGERARRTLVFASAGRFLSLASLRLALLAGADISLEKSHYDLMVEGRLRRELTPWQVHPNLALGVGWH